MPNMQPRAESCMENQPAARRGSALGSPTLKAVLSVFWAIFHADNSHSRANRGGAARREQPGVRGVAKGGARAQRVPRLPGFAALLHRDGSLVCLYASSPLVPHI